MSAELIETAVTGKPMDRYEPYVEMLAHVLANGIALTTDREFLLGLDRTVPLHEAVRDAARDSIKWRFAFEIDRIEEARAEQEQEWQYSYVERIGRNGDVHERVTFDSLSSAQQYLRANSDSVTQWNREVRKRDRKVAGVEKRQMSTGPWTPIEQGDET